uniref:Uncharacterized protein n=1 Tax=Anguilla anguilla TaxID=7936 RepID=A0A0E9PWE8_ANGAN
MLPSCLCNFSMGILHCRMLRFDPFL